LTQQPESEAFYTELFTKSAGWSTTYPNAEEARRAAKILPLLSQVAEDHRARTVPPLRILDLGCGRGWLTYIADMYGECLGLDPVKAVIDFAKARYPDLSLKVGTAEDLLRDGHGGRFDVVIASEVIEHVAPENHSSFVETIRSLLRPDGAVIVSSDRGELYERWARRGGTDQPVEAWLTEHQLQELFTLHGFRVIQHERASYDQPQLSLLHRIVASKRVSHILTRTRQQWLLEGLRFLSAECQVWLFRLPA
jgi:cyclopropane fatty-acyl-phospholipid synthase-like methyltransferase